MKQELLDLVCASYQTDECIAHCNHGPCGSCVSITNYLEANGCIVLPWKIGDTVYYITKDYKIDTDTVIRLTITSTGIEISENFGQVYNHYSAAESQARPPVPHRGLPQGNGQSSKEYSNWSGACPGEGW